MDETAWITPREGAKILGYHDSRGFHGFLWAQGGFCGEKTKAPSDRALDLGLAKPGPKAGEWLWDADFVRAIARYHDLPPVREVPPHPTPTLASRMFTVGLREMFKSPRDWSAAGASARDRRDAVYAELQPHRFESVLANACQERGATAAIDIAQDAFNLAMEVLDPADPRVRAGAVEIGQAVAILAGFGPEHPFVRYGLVAPSASPPELEPFPEAADIEADAGAAPAAEKPKSEWEAKVAAAAAAGYPSPLLFDHNADESLLLVFEGGKPIALVDRCGMRWRNALVAVLRSGVLGAGTDEEHEARADRCTMHKVARGHGSKQPVLKAPKREAGTAPTSAITRDRYLQLLGWLGEGEDDHPLPPFEREAKGVVAGLLRLYGKRKETGAVPASPKQVAHAIDVARRNGETVAFSLRPSRAEVGAVLDRHRLAEQVRGGVAEPGGRNA